jgi:hypothetical protein
MKSLKLMMMTLMMCLTVALFSCESKQAEKPTIKLFKVEKVIKDFIWKNPNWNQNDVILEQSEISLQSILLPLIDSSSLYDDLPMKLTKVESVSESMKQLGIKCSDCGNKNTALFEFDNSFFDSQRLVSGLELKMVCTVNDSIVNKLKNGEFYYIKYKVLKFESTLNMFEPDFMGKYRKVDVMLPNIDIEPIEIVPVLRK